MKMFKPKRKKRTSRRETDIDEKTLSRRAFVLGTGGVGVFGALTARLYYLQVTRAEDYRVLSDKNRFNYNIVIPSRGRVLDRHGEALAINKRNYRVVLVAEQVDDLDKTLNDIGQIISLQPATRQRILKDVRANPSFVPVLVDEHLDWDSFAAINLKTPELAGVIPEVGEARAYPNDGIFAHVLGYVGRAGPEDVENDRDPLLRQPTFRIGKTGMEASVDKNLRGKAGRLKVEVNATGRIVREWPEEKDRAEPGQDVYLTLDAELQRYTAELFEEDSGGAAVIDVLTGELRTLISMPTFDGNIFVSGLSREQLAKMNADERLPQFNKVIGGGYPPASTFKMVVMLAALESGLIDPTHPVLCTGRVELGRQRFHCWERKGHGYVSMKNALKRSCDCYFYEIIQVLGIDPVKDMAHRLGLGHIYDFGLSGQTAGIVPNDAWKRNRVGHGWRTGDSLNASIGQGFVLANPLQLAVMTARLANGREAVEPQLIIRDEVQPYAPLGISPEHLAFVQDAMRSVCEEPWGTAYRPQGFGLPGVEWAGKTGTGQVRRISTREREGVGGVLDNSELPWRLRDHSIFVGYAPYDEPRFAASVIVEHGGSGAGRAATIVHAMLKKALEHDGWAAPDAAPQL